MDGIVHLAAVRFFHENASYLKFYVDKKTPRNITYAKLCKTKSDLTATSFS